MKYKLFALLCSMMMLSESYGNQENVQNNNLLLEKRINAQIKNIEAQRGSTFEIIKNERGDISEIKIKQLNPVKKGNFVNDKDPIDDFLLSLKGLPRLNALTLLGEDGKFTKDFYEKKKQNLKSIYIPPSLSKLENLSTLTIGLSNAEHMPPEIFMLQNLTELNFSDQKLKHVPDAIGKLKNLWFLDLSSNEISSISPRLGELESLRGLSLENNKLKHVPDAIGKLEELRVLNLSSNEISSISPRLRDLKILRELSLENNKLTTLPDFLWDLSELESLDLSNNPLQKISPHITKLHRLKSLGLPDSIWGKFGKNKPPKFLKKFVLDQNIHVF